MFRFNSGMQEKAVPDYNPYTISRCRDCDIAKGKKSAADLKAYIGKDAAACPPEAFRLMFTSNHDENSWAGTEFERMGDAADVMALLTFLLPSGQPLIYTGQEIGYDHRFEFFEKDPVPAWEWNERSDFYRSLVDMRHAHPALAAGEKVLCGQYSSTCRKVR